METINPRKLSQLLYYSFFSLYQSSIFLDDYVMKSFAEKMMQEILPWIKTGLLFSSTDSELKKMKISPNLIDAIKEIRITKDIKYISDYKRNIPMWIQCLIKQDYLDIHELKQIISKNNILSQEDLLHFIQKLKNNSLNNELLKYILTYSNPENFPYEFSKVYGEKDRIYSTYKGDKIKGIIHNHTIYSDGELSLKSLIDEAKKYGYEYLGVSDHSEATMLGMEVKRLERQIKEVNEQRNKNPNLSIFHGIECEILEKGELDYPKDILSQFDYVIVGIHSNFGMSKENATQRVIKAISNPLCDILAHPECRILGSKPGLIIDTKKIIDYCVEKSVVIEINGNHKRLDLNPKYIDYAIKKGAYFELASDIHKKNDFKKINNCILIAEKYSIPKERIINLYDSKKLKIFFQSLHSKRRKL